MMIQSTIPIMFPLKEPELPVQAIVINGAISEVEVTVEGEAVFFTRDSNGCFTSSQSILEPAYVAYIGRQLSRRFN